MLKRIEYNVQTQERFEVDQIAYKNEAGHVLVLDAIDPTPKGFSVFDPSKVDEVKKLE